MNYSGRIEVLRKHMQEDGVTGIFLPLDASSEYFTSVPRPDSSNTPHRQNSAEYGCLLITANEVFYMNSRLSGQRLYNQSERFPLVTEFILFPDKDLTGETFVETCRKLGLQGKPLAYIQDIRSTLVLRLQKELAVSWQNYDEVVQGIRAVKDADELLLMQKVAEINDRVYDAVLIQLHVGVTLTEIAGEIERLGKVFGAECTSFNTGLYHREPSMDMGSENYPVLRRGCILAYDYGFVYKGYCSDFGRTIFIGEPDAEVIKAYKLIMLSQQTGIEAMKSGQISGAALNKLARQVILDGGYDREFGHRLGHGIGKDVHERPFLAEGEERILQTGMCFTVEPSLRLQHKGTLRVEDVITVTPDGGKNFNSTTRGIVVID